MRRVPWGRWMAAGLCLAALVAGLTGCWPFNAAPTAVIVADLLTGTSPLTVHFDATTSEDTDGEIVTTSWDFGDGKSSELEIVNHTFLALTERTTYTVTLTVVDDDFGTDRVTQTIDVLPSENGGGGVGAPVARIVADRIIGRTPLTVSFDARTSEGGAGAITQYQWHFGDDTEGTGSQVFHKYEPDVTAEYTVTLYVWNDEGDMDAEQVRIIVIVPTDDAGDEDPTADIEISDPLVLYVQDDDPDTPVSIPTQYEVSFDAGSTFGDAGHVLEYFVWQFGDGVTRIETADDEVTHIYELTAQTWTYVVRLTVYDDHGLEGTATANLTLSQPEDEEE